MIVAIVGAVLVFGAVGTWLLASSSAGAKCTQSPQERRGSSGQCVRNIQTLLKYLQKDTSIATDGSFGPKTDAAVRKFQSSQGIGVDGIVGPQTWGKLCTASAAVSGDSQTNSQIRSELAAIRRASGC